jgi:manganese/zinc/iron transport system permease protein
MLDYIMTIWSDYTLRTVILGTAILGMVNGALGCFAFLRRQSLLGDAIAHAALPGIALAFLLTGNKSTIVLILGAAFSGWIGMLLVMAVIQQTRIKEDTALGMMLSIFFGLGMVCLTFINRLPSASKAGLQKFLFGMAATMLESDVIAMAVLGIIALGFMVLFWKEFKLLSFNAEYGQTLGFPTRLLDIMLTALIVVAIVIGLEAVGVVLMSSLIVAPAASARQWTDRLNRMVVLAAVFGACSGIFGALLSGTISRLSTGPTIVLFATSIFLISFVFSPKRGLLFSWLKRHKTRNRIHFDNILSDLFFLSQQHQTPHGHPISVLKTMDSRNDGVDRSLKYMQNLGLVKQSQKDLWVLTEKGMIEARDIVQKSGVAYGP